VTTLVHDNDDHEREENDDGDVDHATFRFPRNLIPKTKIKNARLPRNDIHFLELEAVICKFESFYTYCYLQGTIF